MTTEIRPGDHVCWFFETEKQHQKLMKSLLYEGFEQKEKVLNIVDFMPAGMITGYLKDHTADIEKYKRNGQLKILSVEESYTQKGVFDPDKKIALLQRETETALAEGFSALRVIEEMNWALLELPGVERMIEYEARINEFIHGNKCLIICQYDMRKFTPEMLLDALYTHNVCVIGTRTYDNCYYIPPSEYSGSDLPAAKLRSCLNNIAEYRQVEEALCSLSGGIAHNFNNLNMGIQGNADLMLFNTDSNHPNYRRLKTIEKLVQRGSKITNQLLGYAREGQYQVKPINLNVVIEETSALFAKQNNKVKIYHDLEEDIYGIMADQDQLTHLLFALYLNALDAMINAGALFIKTRNVSHNNIKGKLYKPSPGNYIHLKIKDTGIGMDKDVMDRIFEPFFTTKGPGNCSGLGLASVYGVIKAHGGYIDVDSCKGLGTTFDIYLPASDKRIIIEKRLTAEILRIKKTLIGEEPLIHSIDERLMDKMEQDDINVKHIAVS